MPSFLGLFLGLGLTPATDLAPLMLLGGTCCLFNTREIDIVAGKIPGPHRQIVHHQVLLRDVGIELEQGVVVSPGVRRVGIICALLG